LPLRIINKYWQPTSKTKSCVYVSGKIKTVNSVIKTIAPSGGITKILSRLNESEYKTRQLGNTKQY